MARFNAYLLCSALLAIPAAAPAQETGSPENAAAGEQKTMYVNDILYIAVRSAPSEQAEALDVVPSGTKMATLETTEDGKFVRVRLESGEEGWVLQRFLTDEPIARERLEAAQARIERLQTENERQRNELAAVRSERGELDEQTTDLQRRVEELTQELERVKAISAEAVALDQENRRLTAELEIARNARREAEQAAENARTRLYTTAGIAAVLGLGIGFYIGYTPVRRDKKWRQLP